jgi:hypothetical protein
MVDPPRPAAGKGKASENGPPAETYTEINIGRFRLIFNTNVAGVTGASARITLKQVAR